MSPEIRAALAGLHELQVGDTALVLPWPAIGLALAVLLIVALLALYWWHRPRQQLLRQLQHWQKIGCEGSAPDAMRVAVGGLAALLRRAAVLHASPPMPAGLSGDAWLRWLDERVPQADRGALPGESGQWLNTLPYAPQNKGAPQDHGTPQDKVTLPPDATQLAALFALAERWLRQNC